jgi:hypothetical protein
MKKSWRDRASELLWKLKMTEAKLALKVSKSQTRLYAQGFIDISMLLHETAHSDREFYSKVQLIIHDVTNRALQCTKSPQPLSSSPLPASPTSSTATTGSKRRGSTVSKDKSIDKKKS